MVVLNFVLKSINGKTIECDFIELASHAASIGAKARPCSLERAVGTRPVSG